MKGPTTAGGTRQSFLDDVRDVELRFTPPINFRNKTGGKALSIPFLLFINIKAESRMGRGSIC